MHREEEREAEVMGGGGEVGGVSRLVGVGEGLEAGLDLLQDLLDKAPGPGLELEHVEAAPRAPRVEDQPWAGNRGHGTLSGDRLTGTGTGGVSQSLPAWQQPGMDAGVRGLEGMKKSLGWRRLHRRVLPWVV